MASEKLLWTLLCFLHHFLIFVDFGKSQTQPQWGKFLPGFATANGKHEELDGSVTTINGHVFVNLSTSGPWNTSEVVNITVNFLSSYTDYHNTSHKVNITTCHAAKGIDDSWITEPAKGNLLGFCNKSKLCGPFHENVTSLVNTYWVPHSKHLSCHLFTTCSNFYASYGIEVLVITEQRQYGYYLANLSVYNQNVPPPLTHVMLNRTFSNNETAVIDWHYPDSSQLCGFGSNLTKDLQFVIRYFESNQSHHCVFVGEKTVSFDEHSVKFTHLPSRNIDKYIFYLSAKSSINNLTSSPWQKQNYAEKTDDMYDGCRVFDGVVKCSWEPEWNCIDFDLISQALFGCPDSNNSMDWVPVWEVTLFKNGTVGNITSLSKNLVDLCNRHPGLCNLPTDRTNLVDAWWDSSRGTVDCTIFEPCVITPTQVFEFKIITYDITRTRKIDEDEFDRRIHILTDNVPPTPKNLTILEIQENSVVLSLQFRECKTMDPRWTGKVLLDGKVSTFTSEKHDADSWYITLENLIPFSEHTVQVYAVNKYDEDLKSGLTSKLTFRTKAGVPSRGPVITSNERQDNNIILKWKLPQKSDVRGRPDRFVIEVLDEEEKHIVWNRTFYGTNLTSVKINGSSLPKCVALAIRLRMCNGPGLCSPFENTSSPKPICGNIIGHKPFFSGAVRTWLIVLCILGALVLIIGVLACFIRRKRNNPRPRLPSLSSIPLAVDSDYSNIPPGNTYETLPEE